MIYDTDKIKYYSVPIDNYGSKTIGTAVEYDCIIEDTNQLIYDENGTQEKAKALVMIDDTFPGKQGDYIELYKQFGTATGDTKKYTIKSILHVGGFSGSHLEVYI